jgi:restriction system protein
MPIPSYEEMMLPLLMFSGDKKVHTNYETLVHIIKKYQISDEESQILIPSGGETVVSNRAGWARTYLRKAGLLKSPERAKIQITEAGEKVLQENPLEITDKYLLQLPSFQEFQKRHRGEGGEPISPKGKTPLELLEDNYVTLRNDLADELISNILNCSPEFFENLVVKLLVGMGYGGSITEAGKTVGKSGDGGIDGVIKEDKLGLDIVFIQAKRWEGVVGANAIRNFVGALAGQKANKGVFITTSNFTKDALQFVQQIQQKVILIDGQQLAQLMIDYDIGVSLEKSYQVKRVDHDFFEG